jgi:hypothetical protein
MAGAEVHDFLLGVPAFAPGDAEGVVDGFTDVVAEGDAVGVPPPDVASLSGLLPHAAMTAHNAVIANTELNFLTFLFIPVT